MTAKGSDASESDLRSPLGHATRTIPTTGCHDEQRREQPKCTTTLETFEVDMTVAVSLLYQQRGYEKPAEHEEDVDAEEPAKPAGNVGMGNHHREHGPRPEARRRASHG